MVTAQVCNVMLATSMLRHLRKFHAGVFSGGQDFLLLEARDSASHGAEAEDAETRERRARFDAAERALSWMTEFCLDEEGCAPPPCARGAEAARELRGRAVAQTHIPSHSALVWGAGRSKTTCAPRPPRARHSCSVPCPALPACPRLTRVCASGHVAARHEAAALPPGRPARGGHWVCAGDLIGGLPCVTIILYISVMFVI